MTTEQQISDRQIDIMKHALGWPKSYRNHYNTGEGSDDFADCEALVTAGLMVRRSIDWVPDYLYIVTERGKALL